MTQPPSNATNPTGSAQTTRNVIAWLLFPLALFPLAALISYDWRAMPQLCVPPLPSHNWIGALGDAFAYYGYLLIGLAIWVVPLVCVIAALCLIRGRRMHPGRRELLFMVFLVAIACLMQVIGTHANAISAILPHLNLANAGGAIGYLLMTRCLAPLLSDFGSAVLTVIVICVSLVAAIGVQNIVDACSAILRWAIGGHRTARSTNSGLDPVGMPTHAPQQPEEPQPAPETDEGPIAALLRARAEVKRQRAEEKERIRQEKQAEKERIRAEKEAAKLARQNESVQAPAKDEPVKPKEATPKPKPAPTKNTGSDTPDQDKGPYLLPSLSLLNPLKKSAADHGDVDEMSRKLIDTLKLFGIDASLAYTIQGPVVTKYALNLAPGIRYSAVTNISDNLMGALHAKSLRIEAPIPGEEAVGIEVPNRAPAGISFREIIESDAWRNFKGELPLLFGKDAAGNNLVADLASMPHMLVAGATGQGKSVCLNSIINGLLMTKTPEQLKLIMVDPKSVEFTSYASLPHLIVPIITENQKVVFSLKWAVAEMEKRLKLFARARVRNIYDFNHRPTVTQTDMFGNDTAIGSDMPPTVPYIVIIIDEVADLMSQCSKEVSPHIARLTAKARAAGIHLILATQRPDARIITGAIKANIPGRVAFKTSSSIDSRTILDDSGAENLIGRGDMLFKGKDGILTRAQGAWISDPEIARIVQFIEEHSNVQFDDRFTKKLSTIKDAEEDLFADPEEDAAKAKEAAAEERAQVKADAAADDFKKAVECVINTKRASTSHFQRQMGWGYNHAAKILDMLTTRGIVSAQQGMGARQIIMSPEELLAVFNEPSDGSASSEDADAEVPTTDGSDELLSEQPETTVKEDQP